MADLIMKLIWAHCDSDGHREEPQPDTGGWRQSASGAAMELGEDD